VLSIKSLTQPCFAWFCWNLIGWCTAGLKWQCIANLHLFSWCTILCDFGRDECTSDDVSGWRSLLWRWISRQRVSNSDDILVFAKTRSLVRATGLQAPWYRHCSTEYTPRKPIVKSKLTKLIHDRAPRYLADLCIPVTSVEGRRQLRSATTGTLLLPRVRTSTGQRIYKKNRHWGSHSIRFDLSI